MTTCPRCQGCLALEAVSLDGHDGWTFLTRCLICGHRGGDPLMEAHRNLTPPPSPHAVEHPVYDPEDGRLKILERFGQLDTP